MIYGFGSGYGMDQEREKGRTDQREDYGVKTGKWKKRGMTRLTAGEGGEPTQLVSDRPRFGQQKQFRPKKVNLLTVIYRIQQLEWLDCEHVIWFSQD